MALGEGEEMKDHLSREAKRFIGSQASEATRRMYRSDVSDWVGFLLPRGRTLEGATPEDASEYVRSLETRPGRGGRIGLDAATRSRKICVLRSLYRHLQEIGDLDGSANPVAQLKTPRVDRSRGKTPGLAKREVEYVLGTFDTSTPRGLRDFLITYLVLVYGIRVSAVAGLRKNQIAEEDGIPIIILRDKGATVKRGLRKDLAELLEKHIKMNCPGGEYVFRAMPRNDLYFRSAGKDLRTRPITTQSVEEMLRRAARRAGLGDAKVRSIRPHSGRVFFITHGTEITGDMELVGRFAGHSSYNTTRRYRRYQESPRSDPALLMSIRPRKPPD